MTTRQRVARYRERVRAERAEAERIAEKYFPPCPNPLSPAERAEFARENGIANAEIFFVNGRR
jgi:hypothetical protein